jgi:hypothetical protein
MGFLTIIGIVFIIVAGFGLFGVFKLGLVLCIILGFAGLICIVVENRGGFNNSWNTNRRR